MSADEVTAIANVVMAAATLGLLLAAMLALRQVAEAKKSRHAVTATEFSRRWDDADMLESRALVGRYSDSTALKAAFFDLRDNHPGSDQHLRMLRQANYLEDLAILLDAGAVDEDFIKRSLGYIVVSRWELWKDVADEYQARHGMDNLPHFRALAARLMNEPGLA
jgi:hypothetical protein